MDWSSLRSNGDGWPRNPDPVDARGPIPASIVRPPSADDGSRPHYEKSGARDLARRMKCGIAPRCRSACVILPAICGTSTPWVSGAARGIRGGAPRFLIRSSRRTPRRSPDGSVERVRRASVRAGCGQAGSFGSTITSSSSSSERPGLSASSPASSLRSASPLGDVVGSSGSASSLPFALSGRSGGSSCMPNKYPGGWVP